MKPTIVPADFEEYKTLFPAEVQKRLDAIRNAIKKGAPDAQEKISYRMPAFSLNGMLVYYAAHTNHIGFYPFMTAIEEFKKELSQYKGAKGSVQFPHNKPLPLGLITRIVKFRVLENLSKTKVRRKK